MRFGFWSSRSDFKLAREIRIAAGIVSSSGDHLDKVNTTLHKLANRRHAKDMPEWRKHWLEIVNTLRPGLNAYDQNFKQIEDIKYNADILLNERIKQLNEYEHALRQLAGHRKLDGETFKEFENKVHEIRKKASHFIKDDKERDRRLNWRI